MNTAIEKWLVENNYHLEDRRERTRLRARECGYRGPDKSYLVLPGGDERWGESGYWSLYYPPGNKRRTTVDERGGWNETPTWKTTTEDVTAAGMATYLGAVPDELLAKRVERKIDGERDQAEADEEKRRHEEEERVRKADEAYDAYLKSLPDPEEETR